MIIKYMKKCDERNTATKAGDEERERNLGLRREKYWKRVP